MLSIAASETPGHVCIVLLSGLGDVVHGLPLVNAIRDANPGTRLTWVVEPMPGEILAGHPSIDRIITYRPSDGLSGIRELRRALRKEPPIDMTLNLNVYLKSIWPTLISKARRRIGFDRARSFEGVWLASNERIPSRRRAHTADMFLEFAEHLGIRVNEPQWRLHFSQPEKEQQAEFFARFAGDPVATIIPASKSPKKDWVPERWADLADALARDFGFRIVLAGGPGDREQEIGRQIVERSSAGIDWAMGDSVRRLAWIVGGSDILIAPDTGPVHIARALSVPVVGIFGHTNPWRVGPWRAYEDLWVDHYTDPDKGPDPSNRIPHWDRMPTIETREVVGRVQTAVDKYGVGKR